MGSWTIGKKLNVCFGSLMVLTLTLGCIAVVVIGSMSGRMDHLLTRTAKARYFATGLNEKAAEMTSLERGMLLGSMLGDRQLVASYEQQFAAVVAEADAQLAELSGLKDGAESRRSIAESRLNVTAVRDLHERFVQLLDQNKQVEASRFQNGQSIPKIVEFKKTADRIVKQQSAISAKSVEAASAESASARTITFTILGIALFVAAGVFYAVRKICASLGLIAIQIAETAQQVASASGQVSASSQSLAQGASQQAASLEETSASSEEVTSMTRKNSESSGSAAAVMVKVDEHVQRGNRTIGEMVHSMQEINTSSDKISRIIKVIDEISFQTNILALNAAVEAARAGEAGMGFAVVADEVRNLAQRCAQAAKDTAILIEESIKRTTEGGKKLTEVTEVILAITENTTNVKILVDEVSHGSQEQFRGIEQISKAILQMQQVTQNTAASAEQGAAASEEMSAQAAALSQIARRLRGMTIASDSPIPASAPMRPKPAARKFSKFEKPRLAPALRSGSAKSVAVKEEFPMDDFFEIR